jgi:hypothetical protein
MSKNERMKDMSINQILKNVSNSTIGFTQDIFEKPKNISWDKHIQYSLVKEDRYTYIGIFMIMVSAYGYFVLKFNKV